MVTLNPAEHLGLDTFIGGIAPGRHGDLLLLKEPGIMKPELVISKGRVVSEQGRMTVSIPEAVYPDEIMNSVKIAPVVPEDLVVPASFSDGERRVRTLDIQPGGLVTREGRAVPLVVGGNLVADPLKDLLKILFIERISGRGERFVGFVRGWGQKQGAVATSLCWDAGAVVGIGGNDADLVLAVNRVIEMQGGTAIYVEGSLKADIPLRVGGYVSQLKMPELANRMDMFQKAISSLGAIPDFAQLTLSILTTPAIPFIRMTEKGYHRFRENDLVSVTP